jgi:septum formation protein
MRVIYLASQSPQRAMLLARAGVVFRVVPSHADEDAITGLPAQVLAIERARVKARGAVLPADADGVVIGADTVVAVGQTILGSPRDRADAERMLGLLSGSTHTVATGHCCIRVAGGRPTGAEGVALALAKVTFKPLSADEIRAYLATGESMGRAGGYAVQETGDRFVTDLQGSWDTVVGLSMATVARLYREVADLSLPNRAPSGLTSQFRKQP